MKITKSKKAKLSGSRNSRKDKEISRKTKLSELLGKKPKAAEILFEAGMACIGCPMAMNETLEQGCLAHGMTKKETEKLIKRLDEK